jgi:hypothetical protein
MLLEWQDSGKKVQAPPAIKYNDKEVPEIFAKAFPKVKISDYSNGLLSFKLSAQYHLKGKDLMQPLTMLVGFRHFMNYHL